MRPLFYENVVPLRKERHKDWYMKPIESYDFARDTNSLFIAAIEFSKIAREYPIVFGKHADGKIFPVALLGITPGQNLYLNEKGEWLAQYLPAYVRRYPFIVASDPADGKNRQLTVCIDENYAGFNKSEVGNRLFLDSGEYSAVLTQAIEFLKEYNQHLELTNVFCDKLNELGLLESMQAEIKLNTGEKQSITGFMGINREKLKRLKAKVLAELVKSDFMELIYAQMASLSNIDRLVERASGNSQTTRN